eukprot:scaffold803_cov310-Pinguiococcus_pyrenoidosus.AAC.159
MLRGSISSALISLRLRLRWRWRLRFRAYGRSGRAVAQGSDSRAPSATSVCSSRAKGLSCGDVRLLSAEARRQGSRGMNRTRRSRIKASC